MEVFLGVTDLKFLEMRENKETERVGDCSTWYTLFSYRAVWWICTDKIKLKEE